MCLWSRIYPVEGSLQPWVESVLFWPIIQCFERKKHSVVLLKLSQSTSSPSIGVSNLKIWIGTSVREGQFLEWFLSWRSLQRKLIDQQRLKQYFMDRQYIIWVRHENSHVIELYERPDWFLWCITIAVAFKYCWLYDIKKKWEGKQ